RARSTSAQDRSARSALAALSVSKAGVAIMLFLVVSTPRPERPSELAHTRQSFWSWIARYEARGVCRQSYARVGRGAVAVFDVAAAKRMLAAQAAAKSQ